MQKIDDEQLFFTGLTHFSIVNLDLPLQTRCSNNEISFNCVSPVLYAHSFLKIFFYPRNQ